MKTKMLLACVGIAVGVLAVGAQADSISYGGSIAMNPTNWTSSVSVPKFDASLGTLNSIDLTIAGGVQGSAAFESEDSQPTTVEMALQAIETLTRPNLSTLVVVIPAANTSDLVTAFDGTVDYAGTSGKTYGDLSANLSNSSSTSSPADKALFTGLGNIVLPVKAVGASSGNGAGNLDLQFSTSASADVTVTYNYTVPEPATMCLLAFGAFGLIRRRRN